MGWETQALRLVPLDLANLFIHQPRDRAILDDVKQLLHSRKSGQALEKRAG